MNSEKNGGSNRFKKVWGTLGRYAGYFNSRQRAHDPRESLESVKKRLQKQGNRTQK